MNKASGNVIINIILSLSHNPLALFMLYRQLKPLATKVTVQDDVVELIRNL